MAILKRKVINFRPSVNNETRYLLKNSTHEADRPDEVLTLAFAIEGELFVRGLIKLVHPEYKPGLSERQGKLNKEENTFYEVTADMTPQELIYWQRFCEIYLLIFRYNE